MRIGLSLPVTYLNGSAFDRNDELWRGMLGSPQDALISLKGMGITSVEVNRVNASTNADALKQAVQMVIQSGLDLTVHGWLPANQTELPQSIENVQDLLKHYPRGSIVMTVHGHRLSDPFHKDKTIEKTIDDLGRLKKKLDLRGSPLTAALEVCRIKEGGPVGTTFAEVFSIGTKVGFSPNFGICWDVGHTAVNYALGHEQSRPEAEFLQHVIHTHVHDLDLDGRTHAPTIHRGKYVEDCLTLLKDMGYSGIYNLEFYPSRWKASAANCRSLLEASVNTTLEMITNG